MLISLSIILKMNLIYIFLSLALCGSTSAKLFPKKAHLQNGVLKRVTFDDYTSISEAPFMAAVEAEVFLMWQKISTAAIISTRFLTTTARLFTSKSVDKLIVLTGVTNLKSAQIRNRHRVKAIHTDELNENYNDIGLIELWDDIKFNLFQKPIALLKETDLIQLEEMGRTYRNLQIFDFGKEYIKKLGKEKCMEVLSVKILKTKTYINELYTPAFSLESGPISCSSHYGTPAILHEKLAGVASFNITDCKKINCPTLFTGIVYHFNWIIDIVGRENLINANEKAYQSHIFL